MRNYCKINFETMENFLEENKSWREEIWVNRPKSNKETLDFGIYSDNELVGITSFLFFKNVARLRGFYVKKQYRKKGYGGDLLRYALSNERFKNLKINAFATRYSYPILLKNGFRVVKNVKRNNDIFMERG